MNHSFKCLKISTGTITRILLLGSALLLNNFFIPGNVFGQKIFFISDTQSPLPAEKIFLKAYRNEEARDSLFADMVRHRPQNVFMLGDLESRGSNKKTWIPLDGFITSLKKDNARIYAIPGNHEYMGKSHEGIEYFQNRFSKNILLGYDEKIDSVAIILLNSNFNKLSQSDFSEQQKWYKSEMDLLDNDPAVKAIIVCTHRAPYSNSKIVGSSAEVADNFVTRFDSSQKSVLFITGHSHNLEYFSENGGKHFLVIGGGGGITQPLLTAEKRVHHDLLDQSIKPVFFYLTVERKGKFLELTARGFRHDFRFLIVK